MASGDCSAVRWGGLDVGHVWKSTKCHLITPSGRLPQVMDRGNELNGSTYDACGAQPVGISLCSSLRLV